MQRNKNELEHFLSGPMFIIYECYRPIEFSMKEFA